MMRSFKEEFNKEIKTTEENQSDMLEIKNIGSQMKSPVESLSNLMDQGEDRRSVWEDKVEELKQSNRDIRGPTLSWAMHVITSPCWE